MMLNDGSNGYVNWVTTSVKNCLERYGFGYVWLNQGVQNENVFLNVFVNRVKDISLQERNMNVDDNSKLKSNKLFKNGFSFEHYLNVLDLKKIRFIYTNFRIGSLDIEVKGEDIQ
jgi:hypothetical protein